MNRVVSFRLRTAMYTIVFLGSLVPILLVATGAVGHGLTWYVVIWGFNAGWSGDRLLGGRP